MASYSTLKGFDAKAIEKQIYESVKPSIDTFLVEYAKNKIVQIGKAIQSYHSRNHMDRTGNLLNSLCWGVSYNGDLLDSGFYREETINDEMGIDHDGESFMHELWRDYKYAYPVDGRAMAEAFLQRSQPSTKGWRVFFAILAPYWGYWESGHKNVMTDKFEKFAVMTHIYDEVKRELKVQPHLSVTNATKYTKRSIKKRYKRYQKGLLKY